MSLLNFLLTRLGDLVLAPWSFHTAWPALVVASLVAAAILVALFRLSSNQTAVRRGRDRLLARVLELLLFRHDMGVSLTACWRITVENARYLAVFLLPMAISLVPLLCLFAQFSAWFEHRPLRIGESLILEIELDQAYSVLNSPLQISTSDSLQVVNSGVRIPLHNELCLPLRAIESGMGWIELQVEGRSERRTVLVSDRLNRVSPYQQRTRWWADFLNPTATPLAQDSPLMRFDVRYPTRQLFIGDREVHWTIIAFVLMMIFSLALSKLFGIRIA